MRFRARRIGPYNEYLYTFFKCLAADRLMYAEGWYAEQQPRRTRHPARRLDHPAPLPAPAGDLGRFGGTDGTTLTCTMHGWQFDLPTGDCLTAASGTHQLRSQPARSQAR